MKHYVGLRTWDHRFMVWCNGKLLKADRSLKVWNHSPDGFAWGYGGSGPAQLALALLLDVGLDEETAVKLHQHFKREVVAAWDGRRGGSWAINQAAILTWAAAASGENQDYPQAEEGDA